MEKPIAGRVKQKYLSIIGIAAVLLILFIPDIFALSSTAAILSMGAATVFTFIAVGLEGRPFSSIGLLVPGNPGKTFVLSLFLAFLLWASLDLLLTPLIERITGVGTDLHRFDFLRGNFEAFVKTVGWVWLTAAFAEEIIFRGFLLTRFTLITGNHVLLGLGLSSLAFGAVHFYQGISGMIITCIAGVVFGVLFIKSKYTLWLCMLVHGIQDTLSLTMIYLNVDLYFHQWASQGL